MNLSVVRLLNDIECDTIINSVEDNIEKLRISNENGWSYLSAYEMQLTDLPTEISNPIFDKIKNFSDLILAQSFIIKYNNTLIPSMPYHYDASSFSLPINLNNDFTGGGTDLPFLKYTHIPQNNPRGSGVYFEADTLKSWHGALPVTKGDRYVLVLKFNRKNYMIPTLFKLLKLFIATKILELFHKKIL
jgi:hypothetical protein